MAVRQQFLDKTNNGADNGDPFSSLVGGLPSPSFDSPVGDTNDNSQQQQQQQQQAQQQADTTAAQTPSAASGGGQSTQTTDPRTNAQPAGATGVTHPTPTGVESVTVPAGDPSWSTPRGT